MKKYFLYIFACVCALTYATTAQAQTFEDGDIITISYKSSNTTTRYLMANAQGTGVTNSNSITDQCYWEVDVDGDTYIFKSLSASETRGTDMYLARSNNSLTLGASTEWQQDGQKYYNGNRYIRYSSGWTTTSKSSDSGTNLTLTKVTLIPEFSNVNPRSESNIQVEALQNIVVTGNLNITGVDASKIVLSGPNNLNLKGGDGLTISYTGKQLTIIVDDLTVLADGAYSLTISLGAVQSKEGDFESVTYEWAVDKKVFTAVTPTDGYIVKSLNLITVSGASAITDLVDASKIKLKSEGLELIGGTDALSVEISAGKLVIKPTATLADGNYVLTIADDAVKSHAIAYRGTEYNWTVDPTKTVALMHVYGSYDALDNRGYQKVHTVERTMYYTGEEEELQLLLAEKAFFGYMRWYDYTTDRNITTSWVDEPTGRNGLEFDELTDGTVHFGWFGLNGDQLRENVSGQTGDNDQNTPTIKPWADGLAHAVACDVSAYTNFTTTDPNGSLARIVEPTLSYRQIFYFKPASEMADRIDNLATNKFLEVYNYQAPHTQTVLLTTEYRYSTINGTHESELGYFVRNNDDKLLRVGKDIEATWYFNGGVVNLTTGNNGNCPTKDFLQVAAAAAGTTRTYELIVKADASKGVTEDIHLAQFNLTSVNATTHGPTSTANTGITITVNDKQYSVATQANIEKNFQVLAYNDFDFGQTAGTGMQYVNTPLPWEQSTYGFYQNNLEGEKPNDNIPYYGEYTFLNNMSKSWASGEAREDFAMFVDGTTEPGLVASIVAENVVVCAQKQMYCSMWLRNPHGSGNLPNFRCNIQGRNKDANNNYSAWTNIGTFYIGSLPNNSGWRQVVFPITSQVEYNEVRVQLYNFGTGGNGNDFMLDDLTLFVDKSPMSTYQVEPSTLGSNTTLPYTMAVLRVNYQDRTSEASLYYQIYNLTEQGKVPVALNDYLGTTGSATSGVVPVPKAGYVPTTNTYNSAAAFFHYIHEATAATGKYFVNIAADGEDPKYVMYIVHKIAKTPATSGPYPYEPTNYGVRMSYNVVADGKWDEIDADCTMDMLFAVTQSTSFELRNAISDAILDEFMRKSDNNCANTLYTLDVKITQDMDPENVGGDETGIPYADWLKGIASDEVYAVATVLNDATANAAFAEHYGYTRDQVTKAIQDLRKVNRDDDNDNSRTIADASLLTVNHFDDDANLEIIKTLCQKGYLELRAQSVNFYLGAADMARYWVFPIEGTAVSQEGNDLHDTPEPMWVQVSTYDSDFELKVYGYTLPESHATALPIVRTLASKMDDQIVITYNAKTWTAAASQTGDAYLYSTTDEALNAQLSRGIGTQLLQYNCVVDNAKNTITLRIVPDPDGNTPEFKIGEEYIVGVTLRDEEGHATPGTGNNGCPVGTWFFDILLVPDVVTWTGENGADWNVDANWTYVDGEETFNYVPIAGSKVIVKNGTYPTLSTLETNPIPLHVNYPLSPICGEIYFEPGATIQNQHLLQHDKAIVDLVIPQGTWNSVSVPIAGVVTGDMFIPHENTGGNYQGYSKESEDPFDVQGFAGTRSSKSAYAFWQSFFNRTVSVLNENPNKNTSSIVSDIETNTTTFAPTNSLFEPLVVGSGHQLKGWGPTNIPEETQTPLTIRLPKPDNAYSYFYSNGTPGTPEAFDRGENAGKLVYDPDQAIMLTGESAETNYVMFGNPTMAYIDMQAFLTANASMLKGAYYTMSSDSWDAATAMVQADESARYLAPMRSVMLELAGGVMPSAAESGISLLPEHLVATLPTAPAAAPRRAASANEVQKMVIRAEVDGLQAQCIVATAYGASDIYSENEDALFFSSGVEAGVNSATATSPVNMYTVSERVPMMVDVRKGIDTIPMAMLVKESSRTETMKLTFTLSAGWDKDVYFCDAETGSKILIVDGMEMEVTLPANHETRYFIEGPDEFDPNGGGDIWSSTENVQGDINVWAYSQGNGQLTVATNDILKSVEVYDLAGRLIADRTLNLQYSSTSIDTPTGACIVKAVLRDNSVHYLSALVK